MKQMIRVAIFKDQNKIENILKRRIDPLLHKTREGQQYDSKI
jgi:hypothetical protein